MSDRNRRDAVVAALAWALLGAAAGAGESVVRAVLHAYYFNTARSFLSFLAVPAGLYAVGGFVVGFLIASLLALRPRGRRPSALATTLAIGPAGLVLLYWASAFYERLQGPGPHMTLGEIALDAAAVAASLAVFVVVRSAAVRAEAGARSRRLRLARAAVVLVAGFLVLTGLGGWKLFFGPLASGSAPRLAPGSPAHPMNVVLFTIDTVRADHLGCYGYPAERSTRGDGLGTSPVIDRLAREGTRFDAAIVPEVLTDPSLASVFTSLYPAEHGVTRNAVPLESGLVTLAEILSANGYRTGAAVAVEHLDGCSSGMSQGFAAYSDRGWHDRFRYHVGWRVIPKPLKDRMLAHTVPAKIVNARAARWLRDSTGRPFFLWVHYFEPHTPYESHEEPGVAFDPDEIEGVPAADPAALQAACARARALYDSELSYADAAVGELLDVLREIGALDRTLVVVASDHGEHMDEERLPQSLWFTHADVYDETARVPLILWRPGLVPARAVGGQVSTMDVGPTILDLVGIAPPAVATSGRSLVPLLAGGELDPEPLVVDSNPHMSVVGRAIRTKRWKLITRPGAPSELYDLEKDPQELMNIAQRDTAVAGHLARYLEGIVREWAPGSTPGAPGRDANEMLRSLGYLK